MDDGSHDEPHTAQVSLGLSVAPSDILNEAENLLKTKGRKWRFPRGEAENILKKSHLQ